MSATALQMDNQDKWTPQAALLFSAPDVTEWEVILATHHHL
jgi:hypothetical protein